MLRQRRGLRQHLRQGKLSLMVLVLSPSVPELLNIISVGNEEKEVCSLGIFS